VRVLLVSGYESGHQPIHLAGPGAALGAIGHEVRCIDTSVQPLDDDSIEWADALACSVPMHTAMRLAIDTAVFVRSKRPELAVCFYGLYASVGSDRTSGVLVDQIITGEYEAALLEWVEGVATNKARSLDQPIRVDLGRRPTTPPDRALLEPLDRYAMLEIDGERRLAGYVEASRGCRHRCRHCPVPVIYDGRVRVVDPDTVVDDVAALVVAGARHITFGDPDFFNAVPHALKVVEAVHLEFPDLTFDCTIKVEHLLAHRDAIPVLARSGCLFVVTALESTSELVLHKLRKGHDEADAVEAIELLRANGIEMRPTFLPFTPWTTTSDLLDLCHFITSNDLIGNVDPVQMTVRLLVPQGSLLLQDHELVELLGPFDSELLTYPWSAPEPAVDDLHTALVALFEKHTADETSQPDVFAAMWTLIHQRVEAPTPAPAMSAGSVAGRPRLTEPWFC